MFGFSTASALAAPVAIFSENINFFVPGVGFVGPFTQTTPETSVVYTGNGISASVANDYAIPSLSAQASVPSIPGLSGTVESQLTYFIEINGPSGVVPTPTFTSGTISVTTLSPLAFVSASLSIVHVTDNQTILSELACNNASTCPGGTSFSSNGSLPLNANELYKVTMIAHIGNLDSNALVASAFVDPYFDLPVGYTLDISDGIGNTPLASSATPLPASLPLFVSGLSAMALLSRRRRQRTT